MASVAEELERLAALLERGLITREEFDGHKAALLVQSRTALDPSGVPLQVGAYRILGHIGDGGMGTVYRGQHRSAALSARQRGDVAVKVLHPHIARNENFAERFEREAGLGLKLDHPGICKVHDLIVDGGVLALVMELIEGEPLSEVIGSKTGPIPWERAWPMFEQLLEAVAYMHGQRVLHRDIKPDNVLVTPDGKLKLLDLGIAKDTGAGKTRTGVGMGTVDFMAPEQHTDAGSVDERADVYSLGMTLYEMLAGRLPWGGDAGIAVVLQRKLSGQIPPPTDFYPDIEPEVVAALMGALAMEREDRTPSAAALAQALREASTRAIERQRRAMEEARQRGKEQTRKLAEEQARKLAEEQAHVEREARRKAEAEAREHADRELREEEETQARAAAATERAKIPLPQGHEPAPPLARSRWFSVRHGGILALLLLLGGGLYLLSEGFEEATEQVGTTAAESEQEVQAVQPIQGLATELVNDEERMETEAAAAAAEEPTPPRFRVKLRTSTPSVFTGDEVRLRVTVQSPPRASSCSVTIIWWDRNEDPRIVQAVRYGGSASAPVFRARWTATVSMVSPETRYQATADCGGRLKRSRTHKISFIP